jgi:hypothetical protein
MRAAVGVVIKLSQMHKLIDRAGIALEVAERDGAETMGMRLGGQATGPARRPIYASAGPVAV